MCFGFGFQVCSLFNHQWNVSVEPVALIRLSIGRPTLKTTNLKTTPVPSLYPKQL